MSLIRSVNNDLKCGQFAPAGGGQFAPAKVVKINRQGVVSLLWRGLLFLSGLSSQERIRISERVHAGLARARQQGRVGGRPSLDISSVQKIKQMRLAGKSVTDISKTLKISRGSVYQYL